MTEVRDKEEAKCRFTVTKSAFAAAMACIIALIFCSNILSKKILENPEVFGIEDTRSVVFKVGEYLLDGNDPDVVLIGSSLLLRPAVACDFAEKFHGDRLQKFVFSSRYAGAEFFENELSQNLKRDVEAIDLAVSGGLVADYPKLVSAMIAAGKHPKVIICGLSPADFIIGNELLDLQDKSVISDLLRVLKQRSQQSPSLAWLQSPISAASAEVQQMAVNKQLLRHVLDAQFIVTALHLQKEPRTISDDIPDENELVDLDVYRRIYANGDVATVYRQSQYVRQLAEICDKAKIKLVMMTMPVTAENRKLVQPQLWKQYKEIVAEEAGTHFLDMDTGEYQLADFWDSVHLNEVGGKKFFARLADEIAAGDWSPMARVAQTAPDSHIAL